MESGQETVIGVLCTVPDEVSASQIARALLEARLAACVNIAAQSRSMYRWQGKIELADEIGLFIKTTQHRLVELQSLIQNLHPYDVPEIVIIPIDSGLPAYLEWVRTETRDEKHD